MYNSNNTLKVSENSPDNFKKNESSSVTTTERKKSENTEDERTLSLESLSDQKKQNLSLDPKSISSDDTKVIINSFSVGNSALIPERSKDFQKLLREAQGVDSLKPQGFNRQKADSLHSTVEPSSSSTTDTSLPTNVSTNVIVEKSMTVAKRVAFLEPQGLNKQKADSLHSTVEPSSSSTTDTSLPTNVSTNVIVEKSMTVAKRVAFLEPQGLNKQKANSLYSAVKPSSSSTTDTKKKSTVTQEPQNSKQNLVASTSTNAAILKKSSKCLKSKKDESEKEPDHVDKEFDQLYRENFTLDEKSLEEVLDLNTQDNTEKDGLTIKDCKSLKKIFVPSISKENNMTHNDTISAANVRTSTSSSDTGLHVDSKEISETKTDSESFEQLYRENLTLDEKSLEEVHDSNLQDNDESRKKPTFCNTIQGNKMNNNTTNNLSSTSSSDTGLHVDSKEISETKTDSESSDCDTTEVSGISPSIPQPAPRTSSLNFDETTSKRISTAEHTYAQTHKTKKTNTSEEVHDLNTQNNNESRKNPKFCNQTQENQMTDNKNETTSSLNDHSSTSSSYTDLRAGSIENTYSGIVENNDMPSITTSLSSSNAGSTLPPSLPNRNLPTGNTYIKLNKTNTVITPNTYEENKHSPKKYKHSSNIFRKAKIKFLYALQQKASSVPMIAGLTISTTYLAMLYAKNPAEFLTMITNITDPRIYIPATIVLSLFTLSLISFINTQFKSQSKIPKNVECNQEIFDTITQYSEEKFLQCIRSMKVIFDNNSTITFIDQNKYGLIGAKTKRFRSTIARPIIANQAVALFSLTTTFLLTKYLNLGLERFAEYFIAFDPKNIELMAFSIISTALTISLMYSVIHYYKKTHVEKLSLEQSKEKVEDSTQYTKHYNDNFICNAKDTYTLTLGNLLSKNDQLKNNSLEIVSVILQNYNSNTVTIFSPVSKER